MPRARRFNAGAFPEVPEEVADVGVEVIRPWPELETWARSLLIDPAGELANPAHEPLNHAELRVLVTNVGWGRKGRTVLGTAEMGDPAPSVTGWARARVYAQQVEWWGETPDFILTFFGPYLAEKHRQGDAASILALVEHELYHCAQQVDPFGAPKFSPRDGRPMWRILGHDVEEFVGVVRRYGADAAGPAVRAMVRAANAGPEIAAAQLGGVCGTRPRAA